MEHAFDEKGAIEGCASHDEKGSSTENEEPDRTPVPAFSLEGWWWWWCFSALWDQEVFSLVSWKRQEKGKEKHVHSEKEKKSPGPPPAMREALQYGKERRRNTPVLWCLMAERESATTKTTRETIVARVKHARGEPHNEHTTRRVPTRTASSSFQYL